jgi:uncharacterized membrane protein YdjX (TVP38/TMEM64 family)
MTAITGKEKTGPVTHSGETVPEQPKSQNKSNASHWISLGITLVLVVAAVALLTNEMEQVRAFIAGSGWIGLAAAVLIYGLLGASPIPSEPLTVLLSTIFGPLSATLVSGLGNLLAALIEYYIGTRIANVTSFARQREKLPFGLGKVPVESPVFLLVARMLPGYGPKFVSLIGGVYRVPLYRYLWTAAIPTFLGSAIFAYGGLEVIKMSLGR